MIALPVDDAPVPLRTHAEARLLMELDGAVPPADGPDGPAPPSWPRGAGLDAFSGPLGEITLALAPVTESDPHALLASLLVMFGVAAGGTCIATFAKRQRAIEFVLIVGDTAAGRKGTSLDDTADVYRIAYPQLKGLWLQGVASGEGITGHLDRAKEKDGETRALLVEPEFARVLLVGARQGTTLPTVLRQVYDGVGIGYSRAREEAAITDHHVAMLGHITPVELRKRVTDVETYGGFMNRCLLIASRRTKLITFPELVADVVRGLTDPIRWAIDEARRSGKVLHLDPKARKRWKDFYEEQTDNRLNGLASRLVGRHQTHAARLALIYALADRSSHISAEHVEAGIALADYARRSALYVFGDSTGNAQADELRKLLAEDEKPIAWEDAKSALGIRFASDMAEVVNVLVEARIAELVTIPRPGGGRARRELRSLEPNRANTPNTQPGRADASEARDDPDDPFGRPA